MGMMTPTPGSFGAFQNLTPQKMQLLRWERDMQYRNRPLTDENLNQILPSDGFEIVEPPEGYKPIRAPTHKTFSTPS